MSNRIAYRTLDLDEIQIVSRPDISSIEVTLSYFWENDGIGAYEYWGSTGFDHGTDYVVIDEYSYDKTNMTPEEIGLIETMIEKSLDVWCEDIAQSYEPDHDYAPDYEYEDRLIEQD
jgi:hypothetical protein